MSSQTYNPNDDHKQKPAQCAINKDGITIAGYKFSWLIVILIIIVLLLLFQPDTFAFLGDSKAAAPTQTVNVTTGAPTPNITSTYTPAPRVAQVGGFKSTLPRMPTGEIARMFGHDY